MMTWYVGGNPLPGERRQRAVKGGSAQLYLYFLWTFDYLIIKVRNCQEKKAGATNDANLWVKKQRMLDKVAPGMCGGQGPRSTGFRGVTDYQHEPGRHF